MLWAILLIVMILWLLGFLSGAVGGIVHVLLVIAFFILVLQVITGLSRR